MSEHPHLDIHALDNLWFQISGTLCNIACDHCFISCSPTNRSFGYISLEQVREKLEESVALGVKEYYFTGGEPFMHKQLVEIIDLTLRYGPVSVLTNGMLLKPDKVRRLQELDRQSIYSLEMRISLDGYTEEMNDAIRGKGVFQKAMIGVQRLVEHEFMPIITITKTWDDADDLKILNGFIEMLKSYGYERPRLKILPSLKIGREMMRDRGYERYERVTAEMMVGFDESQLLCANTRVATDRGVYVCPILINEPDAKMGETLADSMNSYELRHQACYTCYLFGAICSNFSSGGGQVDA